MTNGLRPYPFDPKLARWTYWGVLVAHVPLFVIAQVTAPPTAAWPWVLWGVCTIYRCILQTADRLNRGGTGLRYALGFAAAAYGECLLMLIPVVLAGLLMWGARAVLPIHHW